MALQKAVVQGNGITTNYHRIVYVTMTTNRQNSIAVISYIDESFRDNEKDNILAEPYREAKTYETDYDGTMTIERAYEYLKTLPEFEGAIDI